MRALTCYPHWAHAIAWLGKSLENRQRPLPAALVGQRIAIHAGAELDCVHETRVIGDALRGGPRWALELAEHWPTSKIALLVLPRVLGPDGVWRPVMCRVIVATAVVRPREPDPDAQLPDWADPHAPYWWALSEVRALAEPVPVRRGQLGLWRVDDETEAAVIAAGGNSGTIAR